MSKNANAIAESISKLGYMGGTFDPVHYGHLLSASGAAEALGLQHVALLPCRLHPHGKIPHCSDEQRLDMLQLAIRDFPLLRIDTRELASSATSYTVDTLSALRQEHGEQADLYFIMGEDAFLSLPRWHRWEQLINLAHLVVIFRPDDSEATAAPGEMVTPHQANTELSPNTLHTAIDRQSTLRPEERDALHDLLTQYATNSLVPSSVPKNHIFALPLPPQAISSTLLRQGIAEHGLEWAASKLPKSVYDYIETHQLYQAAINSHLRTDEVSRKDQ